MKENMDFTLKDTLDVVLKIGERITTFWSFWATVQLTIIIVVSTLHDLSRKDQIIATVAFFVFMYFHWSRFVPQYKLFHAALDELRMQLPHANLRSEVFREYLNKTGYRRKHYIMPVLYLISAVLIMYLVWSKPLRIRGAQNPPQPNTSSTPTPQ